MSLKDRLEISDTFGVELSQVLTDLINAVNDLRSKYSAHIANTSVHNIADNTNVLSGSAVKTLVQRD